MRKIENISELYELIEENIENTATTMKIEERLLSAEEIDSVDDKRRAEVRQMLRDFFCKIKAIKSIEELKLITIEVERKFEKYNKVEDVLEKKDDEIRYSNIASTAKVIEGTKDVSGRIETVYKTEYQRNKKDRTCNEHETVSTTY